MEELVDPKFERIAQKISLVFHPVFMPTFSFVMILVSGGLSVFRTAEIIRNLVILLVFINTCLLPIVFSFTLRKFGFIKSMERTRQYGQDKISIINLIGDPALLLRHIYEGLPRVVAPYLRLATN